MLNYYDSFANKKGVIFRTDVYFLLCFKSAVHSKYADDDTLFSSRHQHAARNTLFSSTLIYPEGAPASTRSPSRLQPLDDGEAMPVPTTPGQTLSPYVL